MSKIKTLDNFLEEFDNNFIEQEILKIQNPFPWYFFERTTSPYRKFTFFEKDISIMQHCFYEDGNKVSQKNNIIDIFKKTFNQKEIDFDSRIIRMNCNLVHPKIDFRHTPYHVDKSYSHLVAIYYLTQSGGKTLIRDDKKTISINPSRNKCILFDGNMYHCHRFPFKETRIVFNFNFKI